MSEWWTYRIHSFVLFSRRTYEHLVEAYNAEVWPLQLAVLLAALALLLWLTRRHSALRDRVVLGVLAVAWCMVAWGFEHQRFATINWAAEYAAGVFGLQALALVASALRGRLVLRADDRVRDHVALAIAALGVVAWPLFTVALGEAWPRAEVVALMPAPTALATLGVLLLVVPLAACAFEVVLLWALYAGRG